MFIKPAVSRMLSRPDQPREQEDPVQPRGEMDHKSDVMIWANVILVSHYLSPSSLLPFLSKQDQSVLYLRKVSLHTGLIKWYYTRHTFWLNKLPTETDLWFLELLSQLKAVRSICRSLLMMEMIVCFSPLAWRLPRQNFQNCSLARQSFQNVPVQRPGQQNHSDQRQSF